MAAQTNARHGKPSSTQMSSLPITCQICLGKVKQPVLCPNCHVFCGPCMNIWLERNQKCPACRVPIDDGNPVKHIRGGLNQQEDEQDPSTISSPELRKIRIDLLYKDYEEALERLQREVKFLKTENSVLKSRLSSDRGPTSGKPSVVGPSGAADNERLLLLTSKLQDAQKLYDRVKQDMNKLKQENNRLKDENVTISRENTKLKEEISHRSPHRYGRLTVATLESQLETQSKEVHRLTKALERSDQYIEDLQRRLQDLGSNRGMQTIHHEKSAPLSSTDVRQMHSNLRSTLRGSTESLDGRDRDRGVGAGHDYNRLGREVGDNHPAKRQLFSEDGGAWNRDKGEASVGGRREADFADHRMPDSAYSDVTRQYERLKPSANNYTESAMERDGPESIMKKSQNRQFDYSEKLKSPSKKVQFDLQGKKGGESSSFDLEAPSPLTSSPSVGKLSSDSEMASPPKTVRKLPVAGDFMRQSYPSGQLKNTSSYLRASDSDLFRSSISNDISKPRTRESWSPRRSSMSHNFDHYTTSKNLSKKMIAGASKGKSDNDSSHLSEPDFDTPRSLSTSPEKNPSQSRIDRGVGGREVKPRNSSFELDGPSLDDTQTIQSELNDLDISMTPELSDCLKLLNRAEKKVHHTDSPGFGTHAGSVSVSVNSRNLPQHFQPSAVHGGMGMGAAGTSSGNVGFPRTYMPGTTGTMSSWEHGFFSTLRVNPYKHAAPAQQPHLAHSSSSGSQGYGSSLGGSVQGFGAAERGLAGLGGSTGQPGQYPVSGFSDLCLPEKAIPSRTGGQPFSRPSSVPPSFSHASSSVMPNFMTSYSSSLTSGTYTHASTAPSSSSTYSVASYPSVAADPGGPFSSGMSRDDLDIGRGTRYPSSRSASGNYSYVSNTSSIGDSKNSDSFMPEPKKRLFDTDDDFELSSPSKTTKML